MPKARSARPNPSKTKQKFCRDVLRCLTAAISFLLTIGTASFATAASLDEAAEQYRPRLIEGIGKALSGAQTLRERVAAKDLKGARAAWISARAGWETFEVFTAGFVPELDEKIDAWPNATTGFHAIEANLFGANRTDVDAEAGALVEHLSDLERKARELPLTPQGLLNGTARLAYEVGENKSDGGESRVSGTSLDDIRNNVIGIEIAYDVVFSSAVGSAEPALADTAHRQIEQLKALLDVSNLNKVDTSRLRRVTEEFVGTLQSAAQKIGLARPSLESSL